MDDAVGVDDTFKQQRSARLVAVFWPVFAERRDGQDVNVLCGRA